MGQKTKTSWQKGQSGNPNGRPRGSRHAISEQFLKDARAAWDKQGVAALEAMGEKDPSAFCRMYAALLPKDANLSITNELGEGFRTWLNTAPDPAERDEITHLRAENERLRGETPLESKSQRVH